MYLRSHCRLWQKPIASGTKSMTVRANYNQDTAYNLIFGYNWRGGTMNDMAPGYYGLRDLAKETTIFVAPQGLNNGWPNSGGEEVTFTDQMVDTIKRLLVRRRGERLCPGPELRRRNVPFPRLLSAR
ncbi:hypothetical protein AJ80_07673 [Polytolypa hystricis UAMH7299]|uniref:Feruloyl esterase C n=1 Tax=Polytolypa hystricis (strain UAMH7299) TaxID=1447883 RepID=A0A2B7XDB8_POLH7|nr:hypothetical protein AJ80_07673 [Polytolypa hystricis UAMH7299]